MTTIQYLPSGPVGTWPLACQESQSTRPSRKKLNLQLILQLKSEIIPDFASDTSAQEKFPWAKEMMTPNSFGIQKLWYSGREGVCIRGKALCALFFQEITEEHASASHTAVTEENRDYAFPVLQVEKFLGCIGRSDVGSDSRNHG